jgi:nucleoid DNA-binding protein
MAARKTGSPRKPATKAQTHQALADATGLSKPQVATIFEELTKLIQRELSKKGPGEFELPGLLKIRRVERPATKARRVRNPFTGAPMIIAAKPKRVAVKVRVLKGLKDLV